MTLDEQIADLNRTVEAMKREMANDLRWKSLIDTNDRLRWKLDRVKGTLKSVQYDQHWYCRSCGARAGQDCQPNCKINEAIDL